MRNVKAQKGEAITIEFFGPFRENGSSLTLRLRLKKGILLTDLCDRLEKLLGSGFRELEARRDVVCILNERVVERSRRQEVSVQPGDHVSFALGME